MDVVKALLVGELNDDFGQKRSSNAGGEERKEPWRFTKRNGARETRSLRLRKRPLSAIAVC